jgi:hypothetical protein
VKNLVGWSTIEVPVTDGTILVEFLSGNIAYLADGHTVSSITADASERLKQLGIIADNPAKLQALEKRWGEHYLKETKATVVLDLTHESVSSCDIDQSFVPQQDANAGRQIVLGIVAGKIPIEGLLTDKWVKGMAPHVPDKLGRVFIIAENPEYVMERNSVSLQRFLSSILTEWGYSYKVSLALILSNPKEIVDYVNPIRRLLHKYGVATDIYLKADEVVVGEKLVELGDVIFRHLLYALIASFSVIPASTSLHDLLFSCTHCVTPKFYSKLFSVLFRGDLLRIVRIRGAGVLMSIDNLINTHLFLPPNFVRCGSGHTVILKNSKAYCCSEEVRKETFVELDQPCSEKLVREKMSHYQRTHFLSAGITKASLLTYGGVCPHEPLETQCERGLGLLSSFFEHFVCLKRGELK